MVIIDVIKDLPEYMSLKINQKSNMEGTIRIVKLIHCSGGTSDKKSGSVRAVCHNIGIRFYLKTIGIHIFLGLPVLQIKGTVPSKLS